MGPNKPSHRTAAAARVVCALLAAAAPAGALAELTNGPLLGPGLRTRPAYDGSSSQRTELVPVVRFLGEPWFLRSTQGVLEGGWRTELTPGLHVGAQLAYEPGRRASESGFLRQHAIADVGRGASIGAHLEWDQQFGPMPLTLLLRARQNIEGERGAQADARFSAGVFQSGPVGLGVFTQATWANAKAARSLYAITPPQSARSGLPVFDSGSGLLFASVGLLGSVDVAPRWVVVGSLESRRLHGDASRSPLAQRASNHYASAGLAYRF